MQSIQVNNLTVPVPEGIHTISREDFAQRCLPLHKEKHRAKGPHVIKFYRETPEYAWEIRNLLERAEAPSVAALQTLFIKLYEEAHADARSFLSIGFFIKLYKRVGNFTTGPYIYEADADFKVLQQAGLNNCNQVEALLAQLNYEPVK